MVIVMKKFGGYALSLGLAAFPFLFVGNAFADPGLDFSVVISDIPILEINLSDANGSAIGATTTMNVVPDHGAAAFNEKTMVVSVGTNNEWGYNLVMSVSNTSLISTEDGSKTIPTLSSKDGGYTCTVETASSCDFTANTWGYKLNAATNLSAATNYLPLQSSINLNSNTGKVTTLESTSISFGSKVNATLAPGTYQTTINFAATANPDPTPIMQNVSASDLASLMPSDGNITTLKDSRDGKKYQITNINGIYWMTDNLKIMGTISAADSNFTGADFNISAGGDLTAGDTYTEPRAHYNTSDENSSTYGAYYNYCAASAGTVCNDTTKQDATSDICPKGWRLPTWTEITALKDSNSTNFNPVLAGVYGSGSLYYDSYYGRWWSATAYSTSSQYYLRHNGSSGGVDYQSKSSGFSVRCVYSPLLTMQNMTSTKLAELMPTDGSTTTLPDSRDGNVYNIARIGNTYWMTDNLKIMGTISASGSNFTGADFNISAGGDLTAGETYTVPRAHFNTSDTNSSTYGAYYNYCAASAGTVCNDTTKQDATVDICPKGWRLPTKTEITTIKNNRGTNFNPVLAGSYYGGSLHVAGSAGFWWSATESSTNFQSILSYDGSSIWTAGGYFRNYGFSVRCVYGPLSTMQNVDSAKLAELMPTDGSTTTLSDSRDGNVYDIARIGNTYWMTDNLKIMGTISAADSNFTGADFNISAGGDLTAGDTYTEPRAHYNTSDENSSTYGAYYNYCAASAGTVCNDTTKQDATSDICPKGWRLPTQTEAQAFADASSSNRNPVLAGLRVGLLFDGAGSAGFWWSATARDTERQYSLDYDGGWYVLGRNKSAGHSVRCMRSL